MNNSKPPVNNLFLLGAGFTKAVFPDAPLNKDLLPVICKGSSRTTLTKYHRVYKTKDIEVLLTHLDLEIASPKNTKKQKALQTVRRSIERQLAEYFQKFKFGAREKEILQKKWLESLAKELFKRNDVIITLNYDCLLEGLLDYYEVWSPKGGYAVLDGNPLLGSDFPQNEKNIRIFKIHGSEHFLEALDAANSKKTSIGFSIEESTYPRSGKNKHLIYGTDNLREGSYIIAPSFVKTPHQEIELMMIEALEAAASANNFVVVGCSLRPEDSFLWLLLTRFLNQSVSSRKLIIADHKTQDIKNKITDHYFVDINRFVNISLFSNGLEKDVYQLIDILKPKTNDT